jgi:hypothetical protein
MNIAIAKPKLGKDSKAFLAKKHHMLIDGMCDYAMIVLRY